MDLSQQPGGGSSVSKYYGSVRYENKADVNASSGVWTDILVVACAFVYQAFLEAVATIGLESNGFTASLVELEMVTSYGSFEEQIAYAQQYVPAGLGQDQSVTLVGSDASIIASLVGSGSEIIVRAKPSAVDIVTKNRYLYAHQFNRF